MAKDLLNNHSMQPSLNVLALVLIGLGFVANIVVLIASVQYSPTVGSVVSICINLFFNALPYLMFLAAMRQQAPHLFLLITTVFISVSLICELVLICLQGGIKMSGEAQFCILAIQLILAVIVWIIYGACKAIGKS